MYWERYVIIDPPANEPGNEASYIAELAGPIKLILYKQGLLISIIFF